MRGRLLKLPRRWTTARGLWLRAGSIDGTVLIEHDGHEVGPSETLRVYELSWIIEIPVTDWSKMDAIDCLLRRRTPSHAKPVLRRMATADVQPLIDGGALDKITALRLLAHVPGWCP